jgi:hypothetical protein
MRGAAEHLQAHPEDNPHLVNGPDDPFHCKCWADAEFPDGTPSGESCHVKAVTVLGLCAKHYLQIVGRAADGVAA